MSQEKRVIRNYNIRKSTQNWLAEQANKDNRSIIKQLEVIIEKARSSDKVGV